MKFLFDYFPIICFFITYKVWGIYVATAVAIATSFLQVGVYWLRHKRVERMHLITLVMITILGGATLLFHKAIFIKWKPTIVYWAFTVALLISQFATKKTLMHRMFKDKIELPLKIWARLNMSWAIFFLLLGALNLYVVYHYSTNAWVNFKLFGTLGLLFAFILGQAIYMSRHMRETKRV